MQRDIDARANLIARTPGLAYSGRIMTCDDINTLGWGSVHKYFAKDGLFAFRWIDPATVGRVRDTLESETVSVHSWDGFAGDANTVGTAIAPILSRPMPDGVHLADIDGESLGQMQAFLASENVSPVSRASLVGDFFPARVRILMDADGLILACGWVAILQNEYSTLGQTAWVGMLAVAEIARGKGLGLRICAETLNAGLHDLNAPRFIGFAALDNAPSKAMLARCGMTPQPFQTLVAVQGRDRPSK